jgi:hypothetical protein
LIFCFLYLCFSLTFSQYLKSNDYWTNKNDFQCVMMKLNWIEIELLDNIDFLFVVARQWKPFVRCFQLFVILKLLEGASFSLILNLLFHEFNVRNRNKIYCSKKLAKFQNRFDAFSSISTLLLWQSSSPPLSPNHFDFSVLFGRNHSGLGLSSMVAVAFLESLSLEVSRGDSIELLPSIQYFSSSLVVISWRIW